MINKIVKLVSQLAWTVKVVFSRQLTAVSKSGAGTRARLPEADL